MFTAGMMIIPKKYPIINTVEIIASSCTQLRICNETEMRRNTPQINASLDKNNSQRIPYFRVK